MGGNDPLIPTNWKHTCRKSYIFIVTNLAWHTNVTVAFTVGRSAKRRRNQHSFLVLFWALFRRMNELDRISRAGSIWSSSLNASVNVHICGKNFVKALHLKFIALLVFASKGRLAQVIWQPSIWAMDVETSLKLWFAFMTVARSRTEMLKYYTFSKASNTTSVSRT